MVITREDFSGVVINAFAGLGFGKEAPFVEEFPDEMFRDGSDLTPIERNLDKIIYGLTKWEPRVKTKGKTTPQKVTVTGKDYVEAIDNMNNLFLRNLWSDGLPLIPPTEERVNWILRGTDLSPDTDIAKILPRGGIASVKALAICLAMAGGRPEYLPVLIAAVEAFTVPEFRHDWMNTTTGAVFPAVIVNGPIAKQIRINAGYGCLGPRPAYPAGGRIGRAIRLVLMCLGGGIAGINTMSIHGNNRYTNAVIAEDEAGLPPDWKPFSAESRGYAEGTNVVTVLPVNDIDRVMSPAVTTKENMQRCVNEYVQKILCVSQLTRYMGDEGGFVGMALMPRDMAGGFARLGFSRAGVQKLLWEKSITPWATIESVINPTQRQMIMKGNPSVFVEGKPWPITARPENIMVVVNGGAQSDHAAYLRQGGASGYRVISKEVKLPAKVKLDKLLKEAELALGPPSEDP
ncbi:MAG: hypothetical protein AABZ77_07030 [Chloroflexota bacterium]